jgi:hypothetical protein
MVSSRRDRVEPPGGLSQYCFTRTAEKPPTPPKYWNTRSTNSAVCGMLEPPWIVAFTNASTPTSSICWSACLRLSAARSRLNAFALEMQDLHSPVKYP